MKACMDIGLRNRLEQPGKRQDRHDLGRGFPEIASEDHPSDIAACKGNADDSWKHRSEEKFETEFQMRARVLRPAAGERQAAVKQHDQIDRYRPEPVERGPVPP